jgi:serpin B
MIFRGSKMKLPFLSGMLLCWIGVAAIIQCKGRLMSIARAKEIPPAAQADNAFGIDLYRRLSGDDGNLFFSPYSISTALAMTYAGARGETEKQMARTLHFGLEQASFAKAMAELNADILAAGKSSGCQIHTANGLWGHKGHPFLPVYLELIRKRYGAELAQVDFVTAAEQIRGEINAWVEKQTSNKIQNLIGPGTLNAQTRLVLANAIYFKGKWEHPFSKEATRRGDFHVTANQKSPAQMMHLTAHFSYAEHDDVQILEIPYTRGALRFVAILPRKIDGLSAVEKKLTPAYLADCLSRLRSEKVEVTMPRFEMRAQFQLKQTLGEMGMPVAFAAGEADFSGMDGSHDLFLSAVIHKAFVDVNEEGTEAAAATGVVVELALARPTSMPRFVADHPFLFLIRDAESGAILFMGRVARP